MNKAYIYNDGELIISDENGGLKKKYKANTVII